jgi:hypothetical protein
LTAAEPEAYAPAYSLRQVGLSLCARRGHAAPNEPRFSRVCGFAPVQRSPAQRNAALADD